MCLHPISFCVPEEIIVKEIPIKSRDFSVIVPGRTGYLFKKENLYYKQYQESYFGVTKLKGGWDCLRHYEILANGCIPYFLNIEDCPSKTMFRFPKKLIMRAMSIPGVSYLSIDHKKFDKDLYYEILKELLEYTRTFLTTKSMAMYLLNSIGQDINTSKILFLTQMGKADYESCLLIHGLRNLIGDKLIDYHKLGYIYNTYPKHPTKTCPGLRYCYGRGFTYGGRLPDIPIDRNNIEDKIKSKYYDCIVFCSIHKPLILHNIVIQSYEPEKIIYICGDDDRHKHGCPGSHGIKIHPNSHHFVRELKD